MVLAWQASLHASQHASQAVLPAPATHPHLLILDLQQNIQHHGAAAAGTGNTEEMAGPEVQKKSWLGQLN